MATWATLRTTLKQRLGLGTGTVYDTRADQALNAAIELICLVNWDFLRSFCTTAQVALSKTLVTSLPSDLGAIDEKMVYTAPTETGAKTRIIRGSERDIIYEPAAIYGTPYQFCLIGESASARQMHVGAPTTSVDLYVQFSYFKTYSDYSSANDADTHPVCALLGDNIVLSGGAWQFAKFFELEEEPAKISGEGLQEMLIHAKAAERKFTYSGPSLTDIIRLQG